MFRIPRIVWFNLLLLIVLDTAVQLTWKKAVGYIPAEASILNIIAALFSKPLVWMLAGLMVGQFVCWMLVLTKADLSYAQPITAASLVTVALCSAAVFGEKIGILRMTGIFIIIVGVWLISSTRHDTRDEGTQSARGKSTGAES
jgi:drug/metabolite transporter (DMT)-like permease